MPEVDLDSGLLCLADEELVEPVSAHGNPCISIFEALFHKFIIYSCLLIE
jgi:hypothetical protein